jgi:hypothetical protein
MSFQNAPEDGFGHLALLNVPPREASAINSPTTSFLCLENYLPGFDSTKSMFPCREQKLY